MIDTSYNLHTPPTGQDEAGALPSPAPAPNPPEGHPDHDPFADIPDAERREFSQAEQDEAELLRRKRDESSKKRKATKRKQADLESKTRELLRSMGYDYGRTEHVGFTGNKHDLFGFIDGIAVGERDLLIVQTTSRDNYAAHVKKMATGTFRQGAGSVYECFRPASNLVRLMQDTGGILRFVFVLWDQPSGPGSKWRHEIVEVSASKLDEYRARMRRAS